MKDGRVVMQANHVVPLSVMKGINGSCFQHLPIPIQSKNHIIMSEPLHRLRLFTSPCNSKSTRKSSIDQPDGVHARVAHVRERPLGSDLTSYLRPGSGEESKGRVAHSLELLRTLAVTDDHYSKSNRNCSSFHGGGSRRKNGDSKWRYGKVEEQEAKIVQQRKDFQATTTKLEATITQLESTVAKQEATIAQQQKDFQSTAAQQQKEIKALTASLKRAGIA